ncbi:MAG: HlyD family type I secretion periplasmic adaptor subunit [Arcobacteraceae bacterium]|nr:HlyD family type I secretion periplasmic adaptor subunit [Arcobacteraceae bacterium]
MDNTKDIQNLEEEIQQLQKELKREKSAGKAAIRFEKELQQQKSEFDQIADTNMAYATTNKDLVVQDVSKAFCDMFGYTKDEIIGQQYNILVDYADSQKFYNGCEYVSTHSKEAWGTDMQMSTKDSHKLYTHTFIYPLFQADVLTGFTFVSRDIHDTYVLNKYKVEQLTKERYTETTLEFMRGTSVAILNTVSSKVSLVVKIVFMIILAFFIWAISFDIEEIVRGSGQVIPTNKIQSIKNLEGGVVSSIYIKEGDRIKKGQILLKLNDSAYQTKINEATQRLAELKIKALRLTAEANNKTFVSQRDLEFEYPALMKIEKNRYITNKKELKSKLAKFKEQLKSQESILADTQNSFLVLEENYLSRAEELEESNVLASKGVFSKYDVAIIEREVNTMLSSLVSAKEKLSQIRSSRNEIKNSMKEAKFSFQNMAKEEYSKTMSETSKLEETVKNIKEILSRTYVRTPVDGVVKELLVNTIGSSISPSEELITIVPNNADIISQIKIAPEDIGKLYVGQRISLKVTAFDYALYGNLIGEITNISPDTITDKQSGNTYYLVQIKTQKDYLDNDKSNKLKVGMKVNTDIIVGKKTILEFVLKPVLRSTQKGNQ